MASLALVAADGLLSLLDDLDCVFSDAGVLLVRTVALTLVLLTTGNLVLELVFASSFAGFRPLGFLAVVCRDVDFVSFVTDPLPRVPVDLETAVRALVTALLIPVLIDCGARTLRFLFERGEESSSTFLRFVPVFVFEVDSRTRSFGRGPSTPRQLSEPHRHS